VPGYEAAIEGAGGLDVALLGIGRNGHLAFNEPGSPFDSRTRVVRLAEQTRSDNARSLPPGVAVPTHAVTMGLATILDARALVLVAIGPAKAEVIRAALEGPIDPSCPASTLRRRPDATVVLDRQAARLLR
jgi:glucosamine-6-phosphate deaminase